MNRIIAFFKGNLIKRKSFIIYSLVGLSGAGLDYLAFLLMMKFLPFHYLLVNVASTTLGITNNFFLNAHFTFGVKDLLFRRFISFYSIGLLGLAVASALLLFLVDICGLVPELSKLAVIFVVVVLQYNLNKRISFRRNHK